FNYTATTFIFTLEFVGIGSCVYESGLVISIILIAIGIRLVKGKKEELEYSERSETKEQTSDVDTTSKKEIPAIEKSPSEESDDTGKEESKDENA
ncbi:MAG: hypothetical protein K2H34_01320, partial [Lachnospiraceae bacterium]|nr:hypothetical protein [Lachnospiraceae bacterium]